VNLYVYVGNNPLKFVDPKWLSKSIVIVVREKIMGASELILKWRIPSIITYISEDVNKYWENSAIMFTLIYEEQSHLFPPIIEDIFKSNTVWLSQISLISQPKDKEYFGFQDNTKSDLLNIEKHLEIMNNRINVIKEKLVEEWREVTPWNIWRAWNWWPECVKQNWTCNKKSISYGDRIEENYPHFLNYNNIITKNKYEYYKNNY
jgi:hypothetical protein